MSYFEDMYDPQLEDDEGSGPGTTTCKYCHTRGLYWVFKDMAWRLVSEAGKLHVCKAYKAYLTAAAGDEFSDLDAADSDMVRSNAQQEGDCSTHPDAPHGFDRTASHSLGRYVCDCEGWAPPNGSSCHADSDTAR